MNKKHNPSTCCIQKTDWRSKGTCRLKAKGWKRKYAMQIKKKKKKESGVAIFIPDKANFKTKTITNDKEG